MRYRPTLTVLMLMIALILALPARAQQKPFTQDQVQGLVRSGLGDDSGAKLIEQRGIDFAPTEDFLQGLKAAGANEAFLKALRAATPPEPASAKKPLNQVQLITLLAAQVPSHRVAMLVGERGIDFDVKDDYLQELRLAGGDDELINALRSAKVTKPATSDPAAQARQSEVRQHMARGADLERKGQIAQAEQEYRAALLLDPQNADSYAGLAYVLVVQQKWDDAASAAREALRTDPNNDIAHTYLGFALRHKGDWDGETAEFHEALRLNPNNDMAHFGLGLALGDKSDWDGEIAEEREALRLNANNTGAHLILGVVLGNKGDWDGEIAEEREAVRLNRNDDTAHNNLGFALGQKGDSDGEIREYREALRLNPNNALAHFNLAVALGLKGDSDSAIAENREVLRLDPKNDMAHNNLGVALKIKGDWDGAMAEYREALRLNPNNDMAHANIGIALGNKHNWDGEIAEEHEALRLKPNNALAHNNLGFALEKKGDRRGALEEYRAATTLNPNDADLKRNYERLSQRLSPLAEATPPDISGEWKNLTSGARFRVRLEQGHAYVEWLVTEEQSKLGVLLLCDLGNEGDKYQGTCRSQWVGRWYDREHYQWRTRACQFQRHIEFTKYSRSRIEGRSETQGRSEEWSDEDNSNCGKRFPVVWTDFVWIRPN